MYVEVQFEENENENLPETFWINNLNFFLNIALSSTFVEFLRVYSSVLKGILYSFASGILGRKQRIGIKVSWRWWNSLNPRDSYFLIQPRKLRTCDLADRKTFSSTSNLRILFFL